MEWLVLAIWILIISLAMPLGLAAIFGRISLGLQPLVALAGLAVLIVIAIEGPSALSWAVVGLAGVGAITTGVGAAGLVSDRERAISGFEPVEEQQATLAGAAIILYLTALLLGILLAFQIAVAG